MIQNYFLSIALATVATVAGAQSPQVHRMDLQTCIAYAQERHVQVRNARIEMEIASARVGQTLADGLPQVNLNADLTYNFRIQKAFIPGEFFGGEPGTFVPVQFTPPYLGNASVSVNQMIFDGSFFVGLQAARTYTQLSRKEHIKSEIDVAENVSKAYYTVLVTKERMELVNKAYGRLDTLLRDTQVMYDNGFAEKIDMNRVKVQYNNALTEKKATERTMALAYSLLKFQMGMPVEEELVLTEDISDIEMDLLDETRYDGFNFSDRIEYSHLETNRELVQLDIKNTRVQRYPQLFLFASGGFNTASSTVGELFDFGDRWFSYGAVGARFSMPIFDGMRRSRMIQQKQLQEKQIENSFELMRNSISLEMQQARTELQNSLENLNAQRENFQLAEEVYTISKIKYQEGVGSNLEVIDADTALKQAQTTYYGALYDALIARVNLDKAYGQLSTKR
jgi:outer membrane protein